MALGVACRSVIFQVLSGMTSALLGDANFPLSEHRGYSRYPCCLFSGKHSIRHSIRGAIWRCEKVRSLDRIHDGAFRCRRVVPPDLRETLDQLLKRFIPIASDT